MIDDSMSQEDIHNMMNKSLQSCLLTMDQIRTRLLTLSTHKTEYSLDVVQYADIDLKQALKMIKKGL